MVANSETYAASLRSLGGLGQASYYPYTHLHWEFRYAPEGDTLNADCSDHRFKYIYNPLTFMGPEHYAALTADLDPNEDFHPDTPYGSDPLDQPIIERGGTSLWVTGD